MELLQNGIGNGAANAATDHAHLLLTLRLGGLAQRADKVGKAVAFLHVAQLHRGGAHGLNDDGDGSFLRVVGVNGNGDAFTVLVYAQDNELSGLGLFGHQGRLDLIEGHGGPKCLFSYDSVHTAPSFLSISGIPPAAGYAHCLNFNTLFPPRQLLCQKRRKQFCRKTIKIRKRRFQTGLSFKMVIFRPSVRRNPCSFKCRSSRIMALRSVAI